MPTLSAEFRDQYIYEMMRLNREATPFETLGHIAGVHYVAMAVAQAFIRQACPSIWRWHPARRRDMTSENSAASQTSGSRTFTITTRTSGSPPTTWKRIGHIAANHSTWDLELDNISVESLVLIYADFRVKQMRGEDGREITKIYTLKDSFDVIPLKTRQCG